MIHGLIVKSSKSDWLRIRNEYSAHAQKIGSGQSWPELSIPATGQKDRGLWGRECALPSSSAFHLSGKIGFPGRKSNGTGLSTENFSKKREYLQRYSSFLVFTGITGKSLYHLLYNTSAVLSSVKIHDFARENGVLLHVSVSNMRLSF